MTREQFIYDVVPTEHGGWILNTNDPNRTCWECGKDIQDNNFYMCSTSKRFYCSTRCACECNGIWADRHNNHEEFCIQELKVINAL